MTAEEFSRRRQQLGWTLEECAAMLGVTLNSVYRYEHGRVIPEPVARLLVLLAEKKNRTRLLQHLSTNGRIVAVHDKEKRSAT
jgi:transcriptional regulator with XRE-family HTH domain